jgi:hypothetical protein
MTSQQRGEAKAAAELQPAVLSREYHDAGLDKSGCGHAVDIRAGRDGPAVVVPAVPTNLVKTGVTLLVVQKLPNQPPFKVVHVQIYFCFHRQREPDHGRGPKRVGEIPPQFKLLRQYPAGHDLRIILV